MTCLLQGDQFHSVLKKPLAIKFQAVYYSPFLNYGKKKKKKRHSKQKWRFHSVFLLLNLWHSAPQQARKYKKTREIKRFFREIAFLAVFPVQKLIFEIAKNGIWSKKFFREIDLFDSMIFLDWTFLNFLVLQVNLKANIVFEFFDPKN